MNLTLRILNGELTILRLPPQTSLPSWLGFSADPLVSVTHTGNELSIICPSSVVPPALTSEAGWRALRVEDKIEFSAVGILSSILVPLAAAAISILSISTFDTDYILVRAANLEKAKTVLAQHFHIVESS
jgi:hypothetical protein